MCATLLLLGASPARADLMGVSFTTYLREGPGTQYRPIDEVARGRPVEVGACEAGWCRVRTGNASGFVAQGALGPGPDAVPPPASPRCFTTGQAGYHGGPDVRFCAPEAVPAR